MFVVYALTPFAPNPYRKFTGRNSTAFGGLLIEVFSEVPVHEASPYNVGPHHLSKIGART